MSLWLWMMACGGGGIPEDTAKASVSADTGTPAACEQGWDDWSNGFFTTYCLSCHSASSVRRHDAPEGINFDTLDETLALIERVQARVIDDETMPIGGGVPADALVRLEDWLQCQARAQ